MQTSNKRYLNSRQNHTIYVCKQFLKLIPREGSKTAKDLQMCLNCLKSNHTTSKCYRRGCIKCNQKHNVLLHWDDANNQERDLSPEKSTNTATGGTTLTSRINSEVLLGTAVMTVLDKFKKEHKCRVLLDSCSQTHFITEKLVDKLQLCKKNIVLTFSCLGEVTTKAQYIVKTTIKSTRTKFNSEEDFVVLPNITGALPPRQINRNAMCLPKNIRLADPEFHKTADIDMLIGATLFYKLLSIGQIKLNQKNIILQKTVLGWIVTGNYNDSSVQTSLSGNNVCYLTTSLDNELAKFWEIEEIQEKRYLSPEEKLCEHYYKETFKRTTDDRYVVRLPFKESKVDLGLSYQMAVKRFYALEKRLSNNSDFYEQYKEFLREYQSLGHMSDVTDTHDETVGYYLPHHGVVKESSSTTKLRVVFDGSAKTSTGISLNDTLMIGPKIQEDLISIILRFRVHQIVLTADIEKMFRQIRVDPRDAKYQKILWRDNLNEKIKVFQLNTVTYGTASAPFLAVRTLQQLAEDEGRINLTAARIMMEDFYMDDLLTGTHNKEEAVVLINQLMQIASKGGFHLRKWASNCRELIDNSESNQVETHVQFGSDESMKILGVQWNCVKDTISYKISTPKKYNRITKRVVLSQIAQLYDPLGLLGPVLTTAKLIMQQLWKEKVDWDESISQSLHTTWTEFQEMLPLLQMFKVNRKITCDKPQKIQMHGFCDASEKAYGCCIYLRTINDYNEISVQLVCAKSRVAPLKNISLPKLELCAATLLTQLYANTIDALRLNIDEVFFWSDSTITLSWINSEPYLLKTFVANRVSEIQSKTQSRNWRHVPTQNNPADYISRGQLPKAFIENQLWIRGPDWLMGSENTWPKLILPQTEVPERRIKVTLLNTPRDSDSIFKRFSNIRSLNRFVAYSLRWFNNMRSKEKRSGELTVYEIETAHKRIIQLIQQTDFASELNSLRKNKLLPTKSKIKSLNPVTDDDGILRVGGRLTNANIPYNKRHPILLPRSHHVTQLIIRDEHEKHFHAGLQTTLSIVRNKYWPIDGKSTVRKILYNCIRCAKLRSTPYNYQMGNLPQDRVNSARPFANVGIDYCGPFLIKERRHRNKKMLKVYIAVFICFCTKAVHLEIVSDLTSEACLSAIRRFFSRRGKSRNVYSDNGTNFIGAKNEIMKLQTLLASEVTNNKLIHTLADEGVKWHFSPPCSPHFGGIWESAVKLLKTHMYRTLGRSLFTYEQLNTCVIEIEAVMNSRPIIPLSTDPNDMNALTPAHFLIGDSLMNVPEYDFKEVPDNRLSLWQHTQKVKQHFWTRWHKEYLQELNVRSKWLRGNPDIKIGTLVTIKENNLRPMQWKLGRIIAVHPGEDGVIRVATVKTIQGEFKRTVKQLCPLPCE